MSQVVSFVPKRHQKRAIQRVLSMPGHGVFLDPGLGKTSIMLAVVKELIDGCDINSALVIAPLRVCYTTWVEETKKWAEFCSLRVHNLHGTSKRDSLGFNVVDVSRPAELYLINPESLMRLFGRPVEIEGARKWANGPWTTWDARPQMLIVDESTKLKSINANRTKTLLRFVDDFDRRVILTGTPAPNGVQDLFAQMLIVDRGEALGRRITHFRGKFMEEQRVGFGERAVRVYKPKPDAFKMVQELIRPKVTVIDSSDWIELPDQIVTTRPVLLDDKARKFYRTAKQDAYVKMESGEEVFAQGGAAVKLKQIANGRVYSGRPGDENRQVVKLHDAKLDALESLLDELGRPALVAFEFRCDGELLAGKFGFPMLAGGVPMEQTERIIGDWNAGKLKGLLVQPEAASHGLNMQFGGNVVIWYGIPWNYETYVQMNCRVRRQGQTAPSVFIYHLVTEGTVDERVASALDSKAACQEAILAALKEEINSAGED